MDDTAWIARIGNAASKLSGNVQTALCLREQEHATVRC